MSKRIDRKGVIEAYKQVFDTDAGKIVLADLVKKYRILRGFSMTSKDDVMFCEGQRQVALYILSTIEYDLNKLTEVSEHYSMEVNYER